MRKLYVLTAAIGLSACSGQDSQQASPRAAQSPVAAALPPAPVPPTSVLANDLGPNAISTQRAAGPRPRLRSRAHFRRRPAPTLVAFADTTPAPGSAEPGPTVFADAKAAQTFWVQPQRDTVLYGAEGTTVWVPANAFVPTGPEALTTAAPVEVRLREFYALADIVLNNLTTNSSEGLLETGGMLHLEARTATGQPCALRPGMELLLRVPTARPKPGMQLYAGVPVAQHGLDWQKPVKALKPEDFEPLGPSAGDNEKLIQQVIRQQLAYSAGTAQKLRAAQTRQQRKAARRHARFTGQRLVEYGRLRVAVNRRGAITAVDVQGIQDSGLRAQLRRAGLGLPAFRPAELVGPVRKTPAPVQRSYLTIARQRRQQGPGPVLARLPVAGVWHLDVGFTREGQVWFPSSGDGYAGQLNGFDNLQAFQADSARQQVRRIGRAQIQTTSLDSLGGYLFSAAKLGWANCDRIAPFTSQRVYFGIETDAPNTRVNLVFRRVRTVVPSDGEKPGTRRQYFHSVPPNEPATVVAIKREKGLTYLALKDVVLGERIERDLRFRPVTPEELRSALATLEP